MRASRYAASACGRHAHALSAPSGSTVHFPRRRKSCRSPSTVCNQSRRACGNRRRTLFASVDPAPCPRESRDTPPAPTCATCSSDRATPYAASQPRDRATYKLTAVVKTGSRRTYDFTTPRDSTPNADAGVAPGSHADLASRAPVDDSTRGASPGGHRSGLRFLGSD